MKKIIYTFIFLLPLLLFACSNNEAELRLQLEISERQNQELINKAKFQDIIRNMPNNDYSEYLQSLI